MTIFNSYVKLPEGIPDILGLEQFLKWSNSDIVTLLSSCGYYSTLVVLRRSNERLRMARFTKHTMVYHQIGGQNLVLPRSCIYTYTVDVDLCPERLRESVCVDLMAQVRLSSRSSGIASRVHSHWTAGILWLVGWWVSHIVPSPQ